MNFETYLQTVKARCSPLPHGRQLTHAQLGMITEVGELGDLIKREFAYGKEFDRINLLEECGDFLWYFVLYCDERAVHTRTLEEFREKEDHRPSNTEPDEEILRALAASTCLLAAAGRLTLSRDTELELMESCILLICVLLTKYDFTLPQCLAANDAKLGLRTGKKFSADRVLGRDVDAERRLLEEHGQDQSNQVAG